MYFQSVPACGVSAAIVLGTIALSLSTCSLVAVRFKPQWFNCHTEAHRVRQSE